MYKRKTVDEYIILGLYQGKWEVVDINETRKEGRANYRAYLENERGTLFRFKKRRVKK